MVTAGDSATARAHALWRPVPLTAVTIDDRFWAPRIALNRERTIPFQYDQLVSTGRLESLRHTWKPGMEPVPHPFWDSDVAKWIEAASYSVATHPDPELDQRMDEAIALLAAAQQPDGYLNTYFTVVKPGQRWTDLYHAHELYCAGHLIEAGVAHFQATGKRTLLDVVSRYADYIATVFGTGPGQIRGYCGHEEIELALVKLYRATGEGRYLSLAQYFIDERGREPNYFMLEQQRRGTGGYFGDYRSAPPLRSTLEYNQAHKPVREQTEVVGHSVRAMYLYSAMADLAAETGDPALLQACRRLWDHLRAKRMYITGGIGSTAVNEGFTTDYDLPNDTAYAETCAAIGLVFWSHRMVQLTGEAQYVDVLERALYNGVISGISQDGTTFFYDNPLESDGTVHRQEWFDVACCPPNLARLLASLGQYIYSTNGSDVAVHLYVQSSARLSVQGQDATLRVQTDFPWDGKSTISVDISEPSVFALQLRIPDWCRETTVRVNGAAVAPESIERRNGYLRIERRWQHNDQLELDLAMPVERMYAHPSVKSTAGCTALQRGPFVYCLEQVDNDAPLQTLFLPRTAPLQADAQPELLGGIVTVSADAAAAETADFVDALYRQSPPALKPSRLTAVPYYAWDNRQPGQMRVWIHESPDEVHGA